MTNLEYWRETLLVLSRKGGIAVVNDKPVACMGTACSDCDLVVEGSTCNKTFFEWCFKEHKDEATLTKKEHMLCEILEDGYIARDESGSLYFYESKPHKEREYWSEDSNDTMVDMSELSHITKFDFIQWKDHEPWSIKDLLSLEVKG